MRITKAMSWCVPNVNALPEIDFSVVAEKTNLTLSEDICKVIKFALAEYIAQVRYYENWPLSYDLNKSLKKVEEACKLLEFVLEWDEDASCALDEEEYDPMKLCLSTCVTPHVDCYVVDQSEGLPRVVIKRQGSQNNCDSKKIHFDGKNVADYLALCRDKVRESRSFPTRPGRRRNDAIRRCLIWLLQCFNWAGGEGRGVTRGADDKYRGPFLAFAKMLLDYTKEPLGYTGDPFSEDTLGALVLNKYLIKSHPGELQRVLDWLDRHSFKS